MGLQDKTELLHRISQRFAGSKGSIVSEVTEVLVVCSKNGGKSQLAAGSCGPWPETPSRSAPPEPGTPVAVIDSLS